jgi:NAD(P)H-hydrate epimerase
MQPIATAKSVSELDRHLEETGQTANVIKSVGAAVGRLALEIMGSAYGKRVLVLAGPGNNGNDARASATWLLRRGVRIEECPIGQALPSGHDYDLIIDGWLGTGASRPLALPQMPSGTPVLSIDVPSGLGRDGRIIEGGEAVKASVTACVGALKPAHLFNDGRIYCGEVVRILPDLLPEHIDYWLVEEQDLATYIPPVSIDNHKWSNAVMVVAGSPGMRGSAVFAAKGAFSAGSGMVHLFTMAQPGEDLGFDLVPEMVVNHLDTWLVEPIAAASARFKAMVLGPGLGRTLRSAEFVRRLLVGVPIPIVLDADGLTGFGTGERLREILGRRQGDTVITPHAGEFEQLFGPVGSDPLSSALAVAKELKATVLLKGSPTVIANPDGQAHIVATSNPKLGHAGTGDTLAGIIAAMLAKGIPTPLAPALGALVHGIAGDQSKNLIASPLEVAQRVSSILAGYVGIEKHTLAALRVGRQ